MAEHKPKSLAASETVKLVSQIVHARRTRCDFFAPEIFSDPAWDMLLVLFQAKVQGEVMAPYHLAQAAGSPLSASLRWIDILERAGLVHSTCDPSSREIKTVELASRGWSAMIQWSQRWIESCPDNDSERVTDLLNRIHDGKV